MRLHTWPRKFSFFAIFALSSALHAACPSSADRFALNSTEVRDSRNSLIWRRCSAGQVWNGGTCTGSAATFSLPQALNYANANSGAQLWRLPTVKELASLADKGCLNPAIDSSVFPNAPPSKYWTSSPEVSSTYSAWFVDFEYGNTASYVYTAAYAVRLVRSAND